MLTGKLALFLKMTSKTSPGTVNIRGPVHGQLLQSGISLLGQGHHSSWMRLKARIMNVRATDNRHTAPFGLIVAFWESSINSRDAC